MSSESVAGGVPASMQVTVVDLADLPERLRVVAWLFLAHHAALETPALAGRIGDEAATAFHEWLIDHGVVAADVRTARAGQVARSGVRSFLLDSDLPVPDLYIRAGGTLYVTQVGELFFDWTARRYAPDAPFPLVWRSAILA